MLRPYQQKAYDYAEGFIEVGDGKELCIEAPTGWGKSHVIVELAKNYNNVVLLTNITKLIYQTSGLLDAHGIAHKLIKANLKKEPLKDSENVILAMQQTLASRKELKFNCDLLVVDERHISFGSPTMAEIEYRLRPNKIISLSATPYDGNGYALPNVEIHKSTTVKELTDNGFLCPMDTYVASFSEKLDFSDVSIGASGDYVEKELAELINTKEYNNEVVKQWLSIAKDKKTIVFASGVEHCEALTKVFVEHGVSADCIHSKRNDKENDEIMLRFKENKIQVLVSVSMITTGFDAPDVECGVMCRPTKTRRLWTQCIGRCLRPHKIKERAIWLDFAQTTREFGMYDEEYEPPQLGDKHSLLRTKEQARIDGIGIHLDEMDEKCAKVSRGEVIATLTRIKQNALSQRNARQIIALYDSSMNLEELVNYGSEIYAIKYGLNVEQRTKDWVLGRWNKFLEEESFSPRTKNIKAFKTRLKNIVKDGKKISSLYYFADWLLEQESASNEAPF